MNKLSLFICMMMISSMTFFGCKDEECVRCQYTGVDQEFCSEDEDEVEAFIVTHQAAAVLAGTTADCD
jgi:hypothetical protein